MKIVEFNLLFSFKLFLIGKSHLKVSEINKLCT